MRFHSPTRSQPIAYWSTPARPSREINAIRKHLSAIKGGRLAQAAYPAQQVSILVSDVPDTHARRARLRADHARLDHHRRLLRARREIQNANNSLHRCRAFRSPRSGRNSQVRRSRFHPRPLVDGSFQPALLSKPPRRSASVRDSRWKSTTVATIGTTPKLPIICCERLRELRQKYRTRLLDLRRRSDGSGRATAASAAAISSSLCIAQGK